MPEIEVVFHLPDPPSPPPPSKPYYTSRPKPGVEEAATGQRAISVEEYERCWREYEAERRAMLELEWGIRFLERAGTPEPAPSPEPKHAGPPREFMTYDEVAAFIGKHKRTVRREVERGHLASPGKFSGTVWFRRSDVEAFRQRILAGTRVSVDQKLIGR